ncbi:UPF0158 family protein [Oceanirhabdus sp. W0125-5]|uniref:UPF0158 family protein n=1 Tax=Oceanirhabdus sp. W0125-5 TaxID=2999116 RepID=UPI0022F2F564|nr:UPF0158 family protein [Oceanirhabdus sp. W0125-5]WBW95592.1 UPF0158 family protein [Oceanirhabdus sp. W0125-5]
MSNKVSIKELKECIELSTGELEEFEPYNIFINMKAGEVVSVPTKFIQMIENGENPEDLEEWEVSDFKICEDIVKNSDNYVDIPNEDEINEDDIMREFCFSFKDKKVLEELSIAINGDNPLRKFKNILYEKGIYDEWYDYLDEKFIEKIQAWCERNNIDYVE